MNPSSGGATPPTPNPAVTITVTIAEPLWAVEDLARVFDVEVDTVRELTYRADFPGAIRPGRRNLWVPAEVIGWSYAQPRLTARDRKRTPAAAAEPAATAKAYSPRRPKGMAA